MPSYSESSKTKLSQCHPDLQRLFNKVIENYDCSILVGQRNEEAQTKAFENDYSKKEWPTSFHNRKPSLAVDAAPWFKKEPHIRWNDTLKMYEFAGFVQATAKNLGIDIRWGGNWDMDDELHDQKFNDLAHFELA